MLSMRMANVFWNLYALCYDSISRLIPYQDMMGDLVAAVDPRPGMRILDVGCGTGNLEKAILETGVTVGVEAVDFSANMLRRAQRKVRSNSVRFHQADLNGQLSFSAGTFDVVVANNVLYALPDLYRVLAELARVIQPNGRLVICDPKQGSRFMVVFWRHLLGGGPIRAVGRALALVGLMIMIPELLLVAVANVVIESMGGRGICQFRSASEWESILGAVPLKETYADQNLLFVVERSDLIARLSSR